MLAPHAQATSLVSETRSPGPATDLEDLSLDDSTNGQEISQSQAASNELSNSIAAQLGQEEVQRSGLPFGAQAARVPVAADPSVSSSSSSSSSIPSHQPHQLVPPPSVAASMRASRLARTPPPPFPEYQVLGQNKAVGVKGRVFWAGLKIFNAMEFVGEVFADFLGLYDSKYQYVVDAYERNKRELEFERAERQAQRREAREEQAKAAEEADPTNQRERQNREEQEQRAANKNEASGSNQEESKQDAPPAAADSV